MAGALRYFEEYVIKGGEHLIVISGRTTLFCNYINIIEAIKPVAVYAEKLTNMALDSVSAHRVTDLFRYSNSQPGIITGGGRKYCYKK